MDLNQWLNGLTILTPREYEIAEQQATDSIKRSVKEPSRDNFKREVENKFKDPIFLAILVILILAITVTGFEVFLQVPEFINATDFVFGDNGGIPVNRRFMVLMNQVGLLLMAEFMMLATLISWRTELVANEKNGVYHNMQIKNKPLVSTFKILYSKYIDIRLFVALFSMAFVLWINWHSGMPVIIRIMIPVISITLGYLFEGYYSEWREEQNYITKEYRNKLVEFQEIQNNPKTFDKKVWNSHLSRAIWNKIRTKNKSIDLDVDGTWKYQAVQREIENYNWADYAGNMVRTIQKDNGVDESASELQILRTLMDEWEDGDNPVIRTKNYIIDMNKITFLDTASDELVSSTTVSGLKRSISNKLKRAESK